MAIKYRLIKLILRRLIALPRGPDLFRYTANRLGYLYRMKRQIPEVKRPVALMIEVTNHCQLSCVICAREYMWGREMDKGHMDLEQFKRLIDEHHVYLDRIGLTGLGETLLYPYLVDAVEYIRSRNRGISIFISTNAYQANAVDIVRRVADQIDTLQVSLDGIGTVFEDIRKKSHYDQFMRNLEEMSKLAEHMRMTVKFNMVVFEDNFRQMVEVVELAQRLGVREIFFNTFNLVANDVDLSAYALYQTPGFRDEFKRAMAAASKMGIYIGYHDLDAPKGFKHCSYPWDNFYITWDGYSVPCCAKPFPKELQFGNIFKEGLMPVLNSENYLQFRRLSRDNVTPEFCERCHKIY
ncbi:radical SAM protein [Candidatus Neomarinimicrobiota bacterium]